jgi:hypothetical protein
MTEPLKSASVAIICALVAGCATPKQAAAECKCPNITPDPKGMAGHSCGPMTLGGQVRSIGRWWSKTTYRIFHPNS